MTEAARPGLAAPIRKIHATELGPALFDALFPYELVLSDYFDTIVSRRVAPEDVKRLWAQRLAAICGANANQIYEARARIETTLCLKHASAEHDNEFNVLACYETLWTELGDAAQSLDKQRFVELAGEIEINLECVSQSVDPDVVAALRAIRAAGRTVYLISDFYLPVLLFRRMLVYHGIDDLFDRVLVSADDLKTKRSGRRYRDLLAELPCPPGRACMIGDNTEADGVQPAAHGIPALLLARDAQHGRYAIWSQAFGDHAQLDQQISAVLRHAGIPFAEMALTLYCFIQRLHTRLTRDGVRDVFFLAREGQFLKILFDEYQQSHIVVPDLRIRSHYFLASRRSTFLPSLAPLGAEQFPMLFRQYTTLSANEFLLNLDMQDLADQLARELSQYDFAARLEEFPKSRLFKDLLGQPLFQREYESRRRAAHEGLAAYLRSFSLEAAGAESLALVDVGWKGTIQDNLFRALSHHAGSGLPSRIDGYYLGLVSHGAASTHNTKTGLLFDVEHKGQRGYAVFNENRSLFESVLGADHGSAQRYLPADNGKPTSVLCSDFEERKLFEHVIGPMQARLLSVFKGLDALLAVRGGDDDWLMRATQQHHMRMVFEPTQAEMDWFSGIYHIENFGVFERSDYARTPQRAPSLAGMLSFGLSLIRRRTRNLGFWPYLDIHNRGGKPLAALYRYYKTHK